MENNNENLFESVLSDEEAQAFDAEFADGAGGDEDGFDLGDEEETPPSADADTSPSRGGQEEEAEAEEEAKPEAGDESEGEPEKQEEEGQKPQDGAQDQRFTLKVNGAESEVTREEVIALAQKGMDYDRIKKERDEFKTDAPKLARYKEQEIFLNDLAARNKISVEALMENVRVQMAMEQDKSLTEDQARAKVREETAARQTPAEKKEEEKAKEPSPEERRQAMFAGFLQAFPNVKAEEIPKEVWDDASRTFDLTGAYTRWESRELRKEMQTLRQNLKNKERSTGSRKSVGATTPKDPFDEAWDSV